MKVIGIVLLTTLFASYSKVEEMDKKPRKWSKQQKKCLERLKT